MVDKMRGAFPRIERFANLRDWAQAVTDHQSAYRRQDTVNEAQPVQLVHQITSQLTNRSAALDGIIMWDPNRQVPVVSKNGKWVPLDLDNFSQSGEATTTAANAGDLITFITPYATPPKVVACVKGIDSGAPSVAYSISVGSVTATNFRARVSQITTSSISTVARDISWVAIGAL